MLITLSLGKRKYYMEQDQVNSKVVPVQRCSSRPGNAGCSTSQLLYRPTQICGDDFQKMSFFMFCWLVIIRTANRWLSYTNCLAHSTLTLILLVEGFLILESSFTFSRFLLNLLCHSKTCARSMVVSRTFAKLFQGLVQDFSTIGPKISSLFVS